MILGLSTGAFLKSALRALGRPRDRTLRYSPLSPPVANGPRYEWDRGINAMLARRHAAADRRAAARRSVRPVTSPKFAKLIRPASIPKPCHTRVAGQRSGARPPVKVVKAAD